MMHSCPQQPRNGKWDSGEEEFAKEESHSSPFQLQKVMLMFVTLISLYLFISCSFVYASASDSSSGARKAFGHENNGFNQKLKSHRPLEPRLVQANDIFTELTLSQGHIHEYENILQGNGTTHSSDVTAQDASLGISCKDENGESVSWYILYKLPKIASSPDSLIRDGSKYYYILPGNVSWTPSENPINSNQSMLAATLQPFWDTSGKKNLSYVIYNDQPPSIPAIVMNGHTKGLIMTSSLGGIWLQHSCPHFPDISQENFTSSYPEGGLINGQMFMCMTFRNTSVIDRVGTILQYTRPVVYNYSIPSSMDGLLPELRKVALKNATMRKAPWFNTFQMETAKITSTGNNNNETLSLKVFAKGPKFHMEVYSGWIAPEYGASLDVQSWLNGPHPFPSNCTSEKYPVYNIVSQMIGGQNFSFSDDHSKWAVGRDEGKPVVCIGDLNRMKPQKTRGGVTICFENEQIQSSFKALVTETEPCNSTAVHTSKLKRHHFKTMKQGWTKLKN